MTENYNNASAAPQSASETPTPKNRPVSNDRLANVSYGVFAARDKETGEVRGYNTVFEVSFKDGDEFKKQKITLNEREVNALATLAPEANTSVRQHNRELRQEQSTKCQRRSKYPPIAGVEVHHLV